MTLDTPEVAPSTSTSEPSQSYVSELISPAVDSVETPPAPVQDTPPTAEPTAEVPPVADAKPEGSETAKDLEGLIQQFAKRTGLDPNDPNQRKTLKTMADQALYIQKLEAQGKPAAADDGLTEFERSLSAPKTEAPVEPTPAQPTAQPQQATQSNDVTEIAKDWRTPEDSIKDLDAAWRAGDMGKVHKIEEARQQIHFIRNQVPLIESYVKTQIQQAMAGLGDVIPSVRESLAKQREADARDFAVAELGKNGVDIKALLAEPADGQTIEFDGEKFPATPFNQIVAANRGILNVNVQHPDPETAARLTNIERYRLANNIYKAQRANAGVSADTAKSLVDAGKQQAERATADKTRQAINAGNGAGGDSRPSSYAKELSKGSTDDGMSFSSLFS